MLFLGFSYDKGHAVCSTIFGFNAQPWIESYDASHVQSKGYQISHMQPLIPRGFHCFWSSMHAFPWKLERYKLGTQNPERGM